MSNLPAFATQTITVQRPTTTTDHGNTVDDWTTPITHTVTGCSVQPAGGSEDVIQRDSITTVLTVYAPIGADILPTDRVVYGGTAYEVDGPIRTWATGVLDHLEVDLRKVAG